MVEIIKKNTNGSINGKANGFQFEKAGNLSLYFKIERRLNIMGVIYFEFSVVSGFQQIDGIFQRRQTPTESEYN